MWARAPSPRRATKLALRDGPDVVAAALGEPAFVELLEALTQTPRFDVAVLFVAGAAKKAMTRAWDEAIAATKEGDAAARLAEARKAYKA